MLASGVCDARSLAFEPDLEAAEALRRNVEINGWTALVSVREMAVGGADVVTGFMTGLGMCNHVAVEGVEGLRRVAMTTLDTVAVNSSPALLKIDVEGLNREVVAGPRATLASESLKAIIIEWPSEVIDVLAASGFPRVQYDPVVRRIQVGASCEPETAPATLTWTLAFNGLPGSFSVR